MKSLHSSRNHKKSSSMYDSKQLIIKHRRGFSATSPTSPEDSPSFKFPSFTCHTESHLRSSSFMQVLNSSITYFSQKPLDYKFSFSSSNPRVRSLEQEKEKIKLENSKLHLALARAKARVLVYKDRVKSLKNYCKIMEVNNFSKFSKEILKEDSSYSHEKYEECESNSSETEFQCGFN